MLSEFCFNIFWIHSIMQIVHCTSGRYTSLLGEFGIAFGSSAMWYGGVC